jgi:hypothetical protein
MMALDQGLITKERAGFELGYYKSEEEAKIAMEANEAAKAEAIDTNAQSITERLRLATGV